MAKRFCYVIGLISLLVGCGTQHQPPSSGGILKTLPGAVVINRASPPNDPIPSQPVTVQGDIAAKLYEDLEAVPQSDSPGTATCTADLALDYTLAFERGGKTMAYAKLNPAGCRLITFNGQTRDGASPAGQKLWQEFAVALGLRDQQMHRVPGSNVYTPLGPNPLKIVVTKDGAAKTITDPSIMKRVVNEINSAGENTNKGGVHCHAVTRDWYRIAIYYKQGDARVFENHGGACQPLSDIPKHVTFFAGQVLSDKNLTWDE